MLPKTGASLIATRPEISDLIVAYDPATLERLPVKKADVVRGFRDAKNERAARIYDTLGVLDQILATGFSYGGAMCIAIATPYS